MCGGVFVCGCVCTIPSRAQIFRSALEARMNSALETVPSLLLSRRAKIERIWNAKKTH